MDFVKSEWNGYERLDFLFEGRKAIVVLPKEKDARGRWMLKTEYFGAFPSFELEMLSRGWGLAHIKNSTRWVNPGDIEAKKPFCDFLQREFGFAKKCLPVGMSCGGLIAINFAAKYPDMPHYKIDEEWVKIPAAWMIDRCGWKGKQLGCAGVHDKQALVLVNLGGATGQEVIALSQRIQQSVFETFGIAIVPEVNFI